MRKRKARPFVDLLQTAAARLRPPFGIVLGSPGEVAELAHALPEGEVTCYQMDLFQADRLAEALRLRNRPALVESRADLWDLATPFQTLIYPVPHGGERALKLDMIEQAYHVLAPHGTLIVLSPYDQDDFFAPALKKVFGKVHAPMEGENQVFWCQRTVERPRRRHEMTYHVRVDAETSYSILSRPGVFGYGFFDEGARALMEVAELGPARLSPLSPVLGGEGPGVRGTESHAEEVNPSGCPQPPHPGPLPLGTVGEGEVGQRVLDLGCGVGTNGILAARAIGPTGFVAFVDSNVRAVQLAEINARAIGVASFQTLASHTLAELGESSFDVVLANPPYYAQGSIIHHFIVRSKALLRTGGTLYLVTKQVDAAWPMFQEHFGEPELFENRGYMIFRATKE